MIPISTLRDVIFKYLGIIARRTQALKQFLVDGVSGMQQDYNRPRPDFLG